MAPSTLASPGGGALNKFTPSGKPGRQPRSGFETGRAGLPRSRALERNIVVHVVELAPRFLRGLALARGGRLPDLLAALARAGVAGTLPAAEHLHAVGSRQGAGDAGARE